MKMRPKLLTLFLGLGGGEGDSGKWESIYSAERKGPKGITRHSMGERRDRGCLISSSFMPLLPNFPLILKL